jgi:16S rRNA (guanine966-N2)-methyltransferase
MRVIAGTYGGRRLQAPPGTDTRPTADRVREALFSILGERVHDARVLDLFAGSGALGLESLSRGAASADCVEVSPAGVRAIRENAALLGAGDALTVHRADAIRFIAKLERESYDVAFADPPYGQGLATAVVERWLALPFAALLGVEHAAQERIPGGDTRRYGTTAITFFRTDSPVPSP